MLSGVASDISESVNFSNRAFPVPSILLVPCFLHQQTADLSETLREVSLLHHFLLCLPRYSNLLKPPNEKHVSVFNNYHRQGNK